LIASSTIKPAVVLAIASTMATFVFVGEAPRLVGFQSGPRKSQPTDSQPILTARASGVSNKAHPFMKTVMPSAARVRPGVKVVPAQRAASSPRYQVAAHEAFIQQVVERDRDDVIGNPFQAVTLVQPIPANTAGSGSESYQAAGLVATETVFLVLQDQTFNAAGNRLFHISVYWWTVVYPGMAPGNSQKVLNKSI